MLTFIQEFSGHPYNLTNMPALTISPDGNHLYWSGADRDTHQIATFSRDHNSGKLSFLRVQKFNPTYTTGPLAIKVSPDGHHFYAAVQDLDWDQPPEAARVILGRDTATGMLTFIDLLIFPFGSVETRDLSISADGHDVYALTGYSTSGLAMLERNALTGKLAWRSRFGSLTDGVPRLDEARAMTLSPDGQFIYTVGNLGVVTFTTGRGNTSVVNKPSFPASPRTLKLEQNYPNLLSTDAAIGKPFTTIRYEIPATIKGALPVELSIYNMQGQLVRTLVNERKTPGPYSVTWNGANSYGEPMPSGIYFYRIKAGELVTTKRLVIIR